ncbi:MAG: outer membrane protein assembly factor BamD [Gemmatimonadaceae bacterium]|nr:outer membrane protein assembly factor BamD [Gemmatimonadaceae bacterium]
MHLRSISLVALLLVAAACRPGFRVDNFPTSEAIFEAGVTEFEARRWENAALAFERLTSTLSPRDSLIATSYWYLGRAQQQRREWLLAAQSLQRLVDLVPTDTIADEAALEIARSYRRLWRKPSLDAQYGETALAAYRQMLGLYPTSPLIADAEREIRELDEWFAIKNYEVGLHYARRKAPDSAIIYLRTVLDTYPETPTARRAGVKLVEVYQSIRYAQEAQETCAWLRDRYADDADVRDQCSGVSPPAAAPTSASPAPSAP